MALYTHDNSTHDDEGTAGVIHTIADKGVELVWKFTVGKIFELGVIPFSDEIELIVGEAGETIAHLIEGVALELVGEKNATKKEGKISTEPKKLRPRTDLTIRTTPQNGFGSTGMVSNPVSRLRADVSLSKVKRCPIGYKLKNGICQLQ